MMNGNLLDLDIVDVDSYDSGYLSGYEVGYRACLDDRRRLAQNRKKRNKEKRQEKLYFLKQRIVGAILILLVIPSYLLLEAGILVGLITIPLGVAMLFSKERYLIDNQYQDNRRLN